MHTSPPEARTGIQLERTVHVYEVTARVMIGRVMHNISKQQVRWGIWRLAQNDSSDMGIISRGPFDQHRENDPARTPVLWKARVMSPYATLDPGKEYAFPVYWSPTRTNPIKDAAWAGAIGSPLAAEISGGCATLKQTFAVGVPGKLVARFVRAKRYFVRKFCWRSILGQACG